MQHDNADAHHKRPHAHAQHALHMTTYLSLHVNLKVCVQGNTIQHIANHLCDKYPPAPTAARKATQADMVWGENDEALSNPRRRSLPHLGIMPTMSTNESFIAWNVCANENTHWATSMANASHEGIIHDKGHVWSTTHAERRNTMHSYQVMFDIAAIAMRIGHM